MDMSIDLPTLYDQVRLEMRKRECDMPPWVEIEKEYTIAADTRKDFLHKELASLRAQDIIAAENLKQCWSDTQQREHYVQVIQQIASNQRKITSDLEAIEKAFRTSELAFYCKDEAVKNGYSMCSLLFNPDKRVNVTHTINIFSRNARFDYPDCQFVGLIEMNAARRACHLHVNGAITCQKCTYKHAFGSYPHESSLRSSVRVKQVQGKRRAKDPMLSG